LELTGCAAQALVTPVRHCQLTGARLPSNFLLNFGVTKHPTTGTQWHLPKLAIDPVFRSREDEAPAETSCKVGNADEASETKSAVDESLEDGENKNEKLPSQNQCTKTKVPDKPIEKKTRDLPLAIPKKVLQELEAEAFMANPSSRTSSGSYLICSRPAMRLVSSFKSKQRMKLIPLAWKEDSWLQTGKLIWRQDMDTFVLELLRKKAFTLLSMLASKRGNYITCCSGYNSVSAHRQVAAVLWLGASTPAKITEDPEQLAFPEPHTSPEEVRDAPSPPSSETESETRPTTPQEASPEETNPPLYAMIIYKSHYIPTYNLPKLLGPDYVARLQAFVPCLQGTMAVIKSKPHTLKVQMELWKLMGYLALGETLAKFEVGMQDGHRRESKGMGSRGRGRQNGTEIGSKEKGKKGGEVTFKRQAELQDTSLSESSFLA
jgi:hypothetical protein